MYYNPMQQRVDNLIQQKQMIDSQLQSLQQMSNIPPININNNIPQQPQMMQSNFDFNGKWVDGEEQAKNVANNNLPLILFDNNNPIFYMKNMDGTFKKFKFQEIIDAPQTPQTNQEVENRINNLENKINDILNAITGGQKEEKVQEADKKGGSKK